MTPNNPPFARRWLMLAAALTLGLSTSFCGGEDSTTTTGTGTGTATGTGTGTASGTATGTAAGTATGTGGSGAAGGSGGAGGTGGAGGAGGAGGGMTSAGTPGTEMVNAGEHASSTNYSMTFTLGQPTQNQQTMTSPSYRLQGGLIGSVGDLP